jgi:hypothetical protein
MSMRNLIAGGALAVLACSGCGGPPSGGGENGITIEESGSIGPGDTPDPNHGNLLYDRFPLQARRFDRVSASVSTDGFPAMLKLVEVSTGAPLAEWDSMYPDGDSLAYTIAAPGEYEVRVYGLQGGTGEYSVRISVNR